MSVDDLHIFLCVVKHSLKMLVSGTWEGDHTIVTLYKYTNENIAQWQQFFFFIYTFLLDLKANLCFDKVREEF